MPIALEDLKMVVEFAEREKENTEIRRLGDILAKIGRKARYANPVKDVRALREDEDVFS